MTRILFFNLKKGFTLVEALVTIAIFTLIMGALFSSIIAIYRIHDYTWQQSLAINEARRGIEVMVKEIRSAGSGDDGSYSIEIAKNKELVFYSDIDGDGKMEKVRYFLGTVGSGSQVKECETFIRGGICSLDFSDFLKGKLISAEVKASIDGDFGASNEYADIYTAENHLSRICQGGGCVDCGNTWQGTSVFNVTDKIINNSISFLADASSRVDPICPHSMKVRFELFWMEDLSEFSHEFRKGITKAVISPGGQIVYPSDQEEIKIITSYVRNDPPIFEYFDAEGKKIEDDPSRLVDTKLIKVYLVVNVDPNRAPHDFELESYVQLRNLKEE